MLRTFLPFGYRNLRVTDKKWPRFGRINLLVGPNNSGKSNFIKAMGFMPEMLICEGGPTSFLHTVEDHGRAEAMNRALRLKKQKGHAQREGDVWFYWVLDSPPSSASGGIEGIADQTTDLMYALGYAVGENDSFPSGFYIHHESLERSLPWNWWGNQQLRRELLFSASCHLPPASGKGIFTRKFMGESKTGFQPEVRMPIETNETVLRQTKELLKEKSFYELIYPEFVRATEELLAFSHGFHSYSSTYLDVHKMADGAKIDLGVRTLDSEGAEFVNVLRYLDQKYDFLDEYAERVRELIPDLKRLKVIDASDTYKQLELHIGSQKYKPREMSDGTLKALWLALILFSPEKGSVLSIDEPELNMHPAWLKVIGGWLQRFSSAEQLFVSTHSPDLLDTFTEGFKAGDVAMFVFGLGDQEMRHIEPAALEGFFKEGWELGDLYRVGEPQLGGWPW